MDGWALLPLHHFLGKGFGTSFADVNKQMGTIKNRNPWSVLNRDLDTLKRRVVSSGSFVGQELSGIRINISLRKVSPKLRGGGGGGGAPAPGATPLPTPMLLIKLSVLFTLKLRKLCFDCAAE